MTPPRRRRCGGFVALLVVALAPRLAAAHAASEATARVTLRDGHLDVVADVDLFLLTHADPTALAVGGDDALTRALDDAGRALAAGTHLVVDGHGIPLAVRTMPAPPELRATAAWLSSQGQDHGALLPVELQATALVDDPRGVAVSLPAAVGPVIASFVQPQTRYARPGDPAAFVVLATSAAAAPSSPALGILLVVAGAATVLGAQRLRRPPASPLASTATMPLTNPDGSR